ncbi:hypothetical protein CDAR_567051 [Caerostris darwini]|uniref:DDE-1 domain-containing protein n=1 Tax=Caerostris darwini TaxID=1538125 RepID=A0AAV4R2Z8_9ARAC|nr:hypothetical protein CDAR_567051 [Caerostris darwini]
MSYIEEVLKSFKVTDVKEALTHWDSNVKHHKISDIEWNIIKEKKDKIAYSRDYHFIVLQKKQCSVALSSANILCNCPLQYLAMVHITKEELWIKGLLEELYVQNAALTYVKILFDNYAAHVPGNQTTTERSKLIDIKYPFIRNCEENHQFRFCYV